MARRFIRRLPQLDNETQESPLSSALFYFRPAGDCNRMLGGLGGWRGVGGGMGWVEAEERYGLCSSGTSPQKPDAIFGRGEGRYG